MLLAPNLPNRPRNTFQIQKSNKPSIVCGSCALNHPAGELRCQALCLPGVRGTLGDRNREGVIDHSLGVQPWEASCKICPENSPRRRRFAGRTLLVWTGRPFVSNALAGHAPPATPV